MSAEPRMDARVPAALQPMLAELLSRLQRELPGLIAGVYLYGSVAYGAFDAAASDVDCLALTTRPCGEDDLARLRQIHQQLATQWPRCDLEISYERSDAELNSPFWCSILWWQIKKWDIALLGPEPAALDFQVSEAALFTRFMVGECRRLVTAGRTPVGTS